MGRNGSRTGGWDCPMVSTLMGMEIFPAAPDATLAWQRDKRGLLKLFQKALG
jgi:hypothetical protein